MSDLLPEYSDIDIVDSAIHFPGDAAARLQVALNPLATPDDPAVAIRIAANTIRAVAETLVVLQDRWNQAPTDLQIVTRAAAEHAAGRMSTDEPDWLVAYMAAHPGARPEDGVIGWDDDDDMRSWDASFIPGWCDE